MSAGRTDFCEECGPSRARGQDFCAGCSTYLAWDAALAPPTSTAAARTPAAAPPDEGFAVAIEAGDVVVADDGPLTRVRVAPGRRITFTVRIRNVGVDVHRYRVDVEGVPTEWVTIDPASLDLLPAGPVGRDGGEVLVTVAPPRASSAGAGVRAIAFNVRSTERDGEVRHLPLELDVEAYTDLTFTVAPARTRGRRRARAVATIQNRGNQTLLPAVTAAFDDPDLRCEVRPIDPIPAGHTGRARLAIRTPPRLLGRPEEHLLEVAVTASDDAPPVPPAVIRHARRALIPWWVPLVLLTLAAIAIALYAALRPEAKVEMPQLRGTPSAFAAQQVLQKQGFLGAPEVKTRVVIGLASGTVVDQAPEAGSKVRPDATVTLRVAVAPSSAAVPDLVGKRLRDADALLTAAHLKLGPVVPSTDPSRRIVSQTPLAGSVRPNGTLVSLVVAGPERVKIPNVRCFTVTNAERRLTQAGLKVLNLATITQPGRRVRTQVPAAGAMRAPGTAVNIVVDRAPKCSTSDQKTADQTAARVGATAQAASGASVVVPPAAPEIPFEGLAWGDADHVVSAESGLA
ncbi:MAG: PASTA domain-containing protein, partial [Patulibacter minatonensis]